MRILDLSAGNRAVWFDKNNPWATWLDIRESVKPTFVCDTTKIPPEVGDNYDLIVFDPPHCNMGANSNFGKTYGHYTNAQIYELIQGTAKEAHRVSRPGALMALKWNSHDITLKRVFSLMPMWIPLFGHITKDGPSSKRQTYWCLLLRAF